MTDERPTVLVLLGCFSRGVEATGPNQSMAGMAGALGDRYRFRVVAKAVPGDAVGEWTRVSGIEQLPLRAGRLGARGLRRVLRETPHDILISNGFFDWEFTIPMLLMRRAGMFPRRPVLLAPRGEISPGSLAISAGRKRAYIAFAKAAGLLRGVALQATTEAEAVEIRAGLGIDAPVFVTPNIRSLGPLPAFVPRAPGEPLRIAFLSRIDRKKNLAFALDVLAMLNVPARFSIFGPVSQQSYWAECRARIGRMPPSVDVRIEGPIPQSEVPAALAAQDLFFLPTLGENYGHAIADALSAGTPALISDRTPWRGLEAAGAGWDLPLSDPAAFAAAIARLAGASPEEQRRLRASTRAHAETLIEASEPAEMLTACLDALRGGQAGPR